MAGYSHHGSDVSRGEAHGLSLASLVTGILGLFVLSIVLGPVALITGGAALGRARGVRGGDRTMALVGVVLGAVVTILAIIGLVALHSSGLGWYVS